MHGGHADEALVSVELGASDAGSGVAGERAVVGNPASAPRAPSTEDLMADANCPRPASRQVRGTEATPGFEPGYGALQAPA